MKIHEQITPETWCKNRMYETATPTSFVPVRWCALGWIRKVYDTANFCRSECDKLEEKVLIAAGLNPFTNLITQWNDDESTTFEQVKTAFFNANL